MDKTGTLRLVYIIGTYPVLTETFIDREIQRLRLLGVNLTVFSIREPHGPLSAEQEELRRNVTYLLPVSVVSFVMGNLAFALRRPKSYFGTLFYLLTRPHSNARAWLKTSLYFGEGVYLAQHLRRADVDQIHAHFADRATIVALVASRLLQAPYSFTAHANDIYVDPVLLPEKIANAKFVATCTGYNKRHLSKLTGGRFDDKITCIYHGLDADIYLRDRLTMAASGPPLILAVGQLKEKKGFTYLLKACRILCNQAREFVCQIVGEGPLRPELEAEIHRLSLEGVVILCGALPHQEVVGKYRQAAVLVLPAVISNTGDRDGIPNVILEALAMEVPVVSTRHSGIPEVVIDNENGRLVPPGDEEALAEALAELLDEPETRQAMGRRGRQLVRERFDLERNARQLLKAFEA